MGSMTTKAGLVAALAGVALLGNMRVAVSEPTHAASAVAEGNAASTALQSGLGESDLRLLQQWVLAGNGDPEDGGARSSDGASEDDGRLVPAIYAWDPEVRFVYYRHVSKWM